MTKIIPTLTLAFFVLTPATPAQEQPQPAARLHTSESEAVTDAADLYIHIDQIRKELEILRAFMGRPRNTQKELDISGVEPREVLFIAFAMLRKADRLCFEQTRKNPKLESPPLPAMITLDHVTSVVDKTRDRVARVKKQLGIDEAITPIVRDPAKTSSDLLRSMVQANRQLNLLLERQFSPSDVYEQVTLAIGYAERLLEPFPGATPMPATPAYVSKRTPADVYKRLLDCNDITRSIAAKLNMNITHFNRPDDAVQGVVAPSDVYDIVSLLIAELAYLHGRMENPEPVHAAYYPGRKFPSDVFQRVGILEAQLTELDFLLKQSPESIRFPTDLSND